MKRSVILKGALIASVTCLVSPLSALPYSNQLSSPTTFTETTPQRAALDHFRLSDLIHRITYQQDPASYKWAGQSDASENMKSGMTYAPYNVTITPYQKSTDGYERAAFLPYQQDPANYKWAGATSGSDNMQSGKNYGAYNVTVIPYQKNSEAYERPPFLPYQQDPTIYKWAGETSASDNMKQAANPGTYNVAATPYQQDPSAYERPPFLPYQQDPSIYSHDMSPATITTGSYTAYNATVPTFQANPEFYGHKKETMAKPVMMKTEMTKPAMKRTKTGTYQDSPELYAHDTSMAKMVKATYAAYNATVPTFQADPEFYGHKKEMMKKTAMANMSPGKDIMKQKTDSEIKAEDESLKKGCQLKIEKVAKEQKILFYSGRYTLRKESLATIKQIADLMKECAHAKIIIEGHTDSDGGDASNQRLSGNRALAVEKQLVKYGVDVSRLRSVAYGESKPVAPNDTPDNKALNRRIEFKLY